MKKNRSCRECDNELKGRSDKKFCDDYCRSAYNYRKSKEEYRSMNRVHRVLKRNRKILKLFWEAGQRLVSKELLVINGFDFEFVTQVEKQNGSLCFRCYEFGYSEENKEIVKLIR
jgi:hypothetical protein